MLTVKYVYWQENEAWLGYLEGHPDYWTQGASLDDLIEHLSTRAPASPIPTGG